MARERAILQDLELEISHQLGDAIRDIDNELRPDADELQPSRCRRG